MKRARESEISTSGSASTEKRQQGTNTTGKIVGLTLNMLDSIRGSKNELQSDPIIILNSERANGDRVFIWQAGGSGGRVYRIEVEVPKVFSNSLKELVISCSCPDAFKRKDKTKRLCKHVYACLFTLVDWEGHRLELDQKKAKFVQKHEVQKTQLDLKEQIRKEQESKLPGERERILFGLLMYSQQDNQGLIEMLTEKVDQSVETLNLLSKLFTSKEMPPKAPQQLSCYRCGLHYDPQYESIFKTTNKNTCRMAHPASMVQLDESIVHKNGIIRHKFTCVRCKRMWFSENASYQELITEQTGSCYAGSHCSDTGVVAKERWQQTQE